MSTPTEKRPRSLAGRSVWHAELELFPGQPVCCSFSDAIRLNLVPADRAERPVTCRRCLRILAAREGR